MNTTIFNRIAFSAMLVGFIGLTSCNKNDEPTPTPSRDAAAFCLYQSD